jgi:hypothetical protein
LSGVEFFRDPLPAEMNTRGQAYVADAVAVCILAVDRSAAAIYVTPHTPVSVLEHVVVHELLHAYTLCAASADVPVIELAIDNLTFATLALHGKHWPSSSPAGQLPVNGPRTCTTDSLDVREFAADVHAGRIELLRPTLLRSGVTLSVTGLDVFFEGVAIGADAFMWRFSSEHSVRTNPFSTLFSTRQFDRYSAQALATILRESYRNE